MPVSWNWANKNIYNKKMMSVLVYKNYFRQNNLFNNLEKFFKLSNVSRLKGVWGKDSEMWVISLNNVYRDLKEIFYHIYIYFYHFLSYYFFKRNKVPVPMATKTIAIVETALSDFFFEFSLHLISCNCCFVFNILTLEVGWLHFDMP